MKQLSFLLLFLLFSTSSNCAVTALTLNPTTTGWATTSGRTTGDISVTNAANRGYAVFNLSALSIPAGCVVSTVTLSFDITSVGGASAPTCTIYGYVGNIASLSATAIYAACTASTTSLYTATWGTVAASPKTMATTAAAVSFVSSNLSNTISVCWVESASSRTYAINGSSSPVPVLTVSYCNAPTAVSITAAPNPVCSGSSLTLTGAATGAAGGTFSWSGPNSFSSTLQNPSAFTTSTLSAGVYSFTATSACGSSAAMATKAVTVNTASPTAITGGSATLCGATGYTMSLSDAISGGVWTSSAPANATISNTGLLTSVTTGATTVSYTTGCGSAATLTVTVRAIPTVAVNNPTGIACYGASVSITASGATSYTWSPASGLSGTATATVTATPTTTTTYTVTGTTTGCSNTATSTIVGSTSQATFAITATAAPATTCSGGASTLYESITNSNYNTMSSITYAALATTGTSVLVGEDDNYVTVSIPFTFNFYGLNYTSVNICSNGYINFGTPTSDYSSYTLPDGSAPEGQVALFAHDLDLSSGGNIKYTTTGSTPNRKFIVSYNAVSDYGGGPTNTGQIILYETSNNIDILIASVTEAGVNNVTTGIQDLYGSTGLGATGRNGIDFDATNEAWHFAGIAATTDYTYTWAPSAILSSSTSASPVASPISAATTFTVTATDPSSGCYKKATTTVNIGSITGTISANTQVCTGSSAQVIFTGPGNGTATYKLNGGSPVTVSLNPAGLDTIVTGALSSGRVYSLISVASGACSQTISGQNDTITVISPPTVVLSPTSATYCYGSGVTLTASGTATTYTWSPSSSLSASTGATVSATPTVTTTYTLTGAIGSCQVTRTATVGLGAPFTVVAVATPTITCSGGSSSFSDTITNTNFNTVTSITYAAVSTAGTSILAGLDDDNTSISIPFTFFFYGVGYTSVSVCTNGFINFGTPVTDYSAYVLPDGSAPEGLVALFMHDLDLTTSGNIKYQTLGSAPNRKFVISFNAVPDYDGSSTNTGQIILYETTNIIDILVAHSLSDVEATVGIQDLTGSNGIAAPGRNGVNFAVSTAEAWRFTGVPTSGYTYSWAPASIMSSSTSASPTASPIASTTVFTLTTTDATTGCSNTTTDTVTVGTLPGTISGTTAICAYNTTNITFHGPALATATYTINGGAPLTITLDGTGTAVLATGSLTTTSVYVLTTITSGICVQAITGQTATVTINPAAGPISGTTTLCVGSTVTFTNPTSGGTWSSSVTGRATVNSSTGAVTGVAVGAVNISYTVGSCPATFFPMTIITTPAAITPAAAVSICATATTTLADATTGGRWSSSNTARATIDTASGIVTGIAAGTVTLTYSNGCGTAPTKTITVNTMPAAITGISLAIAPAAICTLTTYSSFTNSVSGGTWSNSPTTVGTIVSGTGVFNSGTATGTTTLTYTIGSCSVNASLTIGSTSPGSISGSTTVCATDSTTLTNAVGGGVWSSSNAALATVNLSSGLVTGINAGSVTITYNNGCGTPATLGFTVNGSTVIVSADTVCSGTTLHLRATVAAAGSYAWTGPNGYTSTLQSPSISGVTTQAAGTYTFSTTSSAGSCTSSGQVFGIVDSMPNVTVTASPASFCNSGVSSLSDVVGSPTAQLVYAIPYSPVAVAGGTNGPVGDDVSLNATIPFTFKYYGTNFTTVRICTNGFINFGAVNTDYNSLPLPDATTAPGMVALFWQDLYANTGEIKYTTVGTTPNRKFVISFNSVYDLSGTSPNTGQIVLYETKNMIDIYVAHANEAGSFSPVCGIQNSTGTAAITVPGENAEYYSVTGPGEGWRFVTPSYTYSWLPSASLSSATVANPTTTTLTTTQVYTVTTRDIYSSCTGNVTTKTVTVNPLPTAYTVTGGGIYCSVPGTGAHIGLSNSQTGVNYQLKRGSTNVGSPVAGTGAAFDFGLFTDTTAAYTVVAANATTSCTSTMTGSITLSRRVSPTAYSLTGGSGCSAAISIGLSGSQSGVSYQLYNGATTTGSPLSGTGSALSYGTMSAAGTYTIIGTGSGGCTTNMTGSSVINLTPATYTVSGGTACSAIGVTIGLSGSQSGINYQLYRGVSTVGGTISGTGSAFSIGSFTTTGTYKIVADGGGGCTTTMNDSAVVNTSVSLSAGANPSVCQPTSGATLSYSGATGSPTTYSIVWSAAALSAGFSNVTAASLPGTIPLTIPSGAAGTFNATLTVSNGACTSTPYSISTTVYAHPAAAITSASVPCSGYATNIVFTGTSGAIADYSIDGGTTASATLTGGTYSLSTGAITSSHSYRLINAHNPVCSTTIDTTITISPLQMTWTGGTAGHLTDWNTAANWSCGSVPTSTDNVRIPPTTYAPFVAASTSVNTHNLIIDSAVVLTVDTLSTLHISGNFTNNGHIIDDGSVVLNGSSAQTISGTGYINNLELNNSAGATITAGSKVTVYNMVTLTSGTLATGDSLVLGVDTTSIYSYEYHTGIINAIPSGASITGNVKIQQYIIMGRRAYRFWSHPFSSYTALNMVGNYIDVTGQGGASNGFTGTASNAPSAFRYNPLEGNSSLASDPGWKPYTSAYGTADSNRLHPYQGIRLFYRGKKGEGMGYAPYVPSADIIQQWGQVNQGNQTIHLSKGSGANQDYNMVGNPYPSPVDIGTVVYNAKISGNVTGAAYYLWNPWLGTVGQFMAMFIPTATAIPVYLEMNTAFQVRAAHPGDSLNFTESNKGYSPWMILLREQPQYISLMVYNTDYHPYDMLYVQFNNAATNGEDKDYDATKPPSCAEFNFYSLSADHQKLAVDARPYKAGKVIPLGISSSYAQDFIIKAESVPLPDNAHLYLHDKLLQQYILLQQGSEYRFSITADTKTQGEQRFELSMEPATVVQNKGLDVSMLPNPATNEVSIHFTSIQKEQVSLRVLDLSGICVYNRDLGMQQKGSTTISLHNFASGIYLVELTSGKQKVVQRLIKE